QVELKQLIHNYFDNPLISLKLCFTTETRFLISSISENKPGQLLRLYLFNVCNINNKLVLIRILVLCSPLLTAHVFFFSYSFAQAAPVQATIAKEVKVENGDDEDDDDIDLFGSDEDNEEAERLKQERLEAYAAKKAKKPTLIAKSSILLDVKPWDDETDMAKLEEYVRSVQMDGLLWGASKLVPVGYGIKKLQINCVVEDDKVGTDILEEEITKFEDFVQSVDVAAFNKI
ncbi:elongation factor 1-delta-like isoform X5, partial [Solea senegalensis]